jgi:hypothetical protein
MAAMLLLALVISATNACGNAETSLDIEVFPAPIAVVTNNSVQQVLSSSSGVSYQWYFNGAPINGATNATYSYMQSGDYFVEVTNENGCIDASTIMNVTYIGIGEIMATQLSVYPNPVGDKLTLTASENLIGQTFVLRNILGQQVVASQKIVQSTTEVNTAALSSGIYFLELNTGSVIRFMVD